MDASAAIREQLSRIAARPPGAPVGGPHSVAELLEHIPLNVDGHELHWTRREARRLLFVLWLLDRERFLMPEIAFIRTKAGRVHKAVLVAGVRFVQEACNLDDAPGEETVITFADLESAEPGDLCGRCFPPRPPREDPA